MWLLSFEFTFVNENSAPKEGLSPTPLAYSGRLNRTLTRASLVIVIARIGIWKAYRRTEVRLKSFQTPLRTSTTTTEIYPQETKI